MDTPRLLEHFHRLAEAPGAIPRLRRLVLDLAVRGKLVAQDPAEEPASVLLERIAAEKVRLISAGELKAERSIKNSIHSRSPFDLPAGWQWANLQETCISISDGDHQPPPKSDAGIPFLVIGDVRNKVINYQPDRTVAEIYFNALDPIRKPRSGDLLYTLVGSFGIPVIVRDDKPFCVQRHIAIIRPSQSIGVHWLACFMESEFIFTQSESCATGIAQKTVPLSGLRAIRLPVPPLAEQHRIVAKVDELMGLLDRIESAQASREATRQQLATASLARLTSATDDTDFQTSADFLLQTLPTHTTRREQIKQLRQTILNLAVRGKLVPQDPADESAQRQLALLQEKRNHLHQSENLRDRKPAPMTTRADLHFDFPLNWELAIFDQIFAIVSGVAKGGKQAVKDSVDAPYLRVANVQRGHLDLDVIKVLNVSRFDYERYQLKQNDILMTEGGDWDKLGRAAIWQCQIPDCIHQNHVFRVRPPSDDISPNWVVIYVNSQLGRRYFENAAKQTTNLASINMTQLRACPLPLPPLAEQHRIVAKVDELMALCDRLDTALAQAETARARLLDAELHAALDDREPSELAA